MVEQQRLNLAKATSVFKMGPIQQTGPGGEGGPLSIQADRCVPAITVRVCVCVREKVCMFCNGKTLGAGAAPHI